MILYLNEDALKIEQGGKGISVLILSEQQIMEHYLMEDAIVDLKKGLKAKRDAMIANPERTVINFSDVDGTALYMPSADLQAEKASIKVVTIFPQNPQVGKPTTQGVLLLSDAKNGEHLCLMDASYLTRLRTGALSGIATEIFARDDSEVLGVIGTGGMAYEQVLGVLAVRDIKRIILFNRTEEKAHRFKEKLLKFGVTCDISVMNHVDQVVKSADVLSCATRSEVPVFDGHLLKSGTHINGVGSFLPSMREVDLTTIHKASKIIVDDLHGAKEEAGELIHAAEQSDWHFKDVYAELFEVDGVKLKRETRDEITFFKSVGSAFFDQAVGQGIYRKARELGFGKTVEI